MQNLSIRKTLELLTLLLSILAAAPAQAAIFRVDATNDGVDAVPGDGACATAATTCTLRAAIQEANALNGVDLIELPATPPPSLYSLDLGGDNEDEAATGDLDVSDNLIIHGTGAGRITLDVVPTDRIFDIAAGITVEISNLMMQSGNAGPANGGGIRNRGNLVMSQLTIRDCEAAGGGAIANLDNATLHLTNVTLSGNTVADQGGGLLNINNARATLTNVTLANNSASAGGGIFNLVRGTTGDPGISLQNTLLANIDGTNCAGTPVTSLGNNLETLTTCVFSGPGDKSSTAAAIGPLQLNGGNSSTHALFENSAAIDGGSPATCPGLDQRDRLRPADGDHNGSAICDIGAFEFEAVAPTATPANTATPTLTPTVTGTLPPSNTPTDTETPTPTATETSTATSTTTQTGTITPTPVLSFTPTRTPTMGPPTATDTPTETATGTSTSTKTETPLASPTASPSATPTATVEPPRLVVDSVEAQPGESAFVSVVLRSGSFQVSSASNNLTFDPVNAPIAPLSNGRPDCVAAPGLGSAFRYRPQDCIETACTSVFASVLPLTFPFDAIPDGTAIYTCRIEVPADAALGTYPLTIDNIVVADLQSNRIPSAFGVDGAVSVVRVCLGDCDGDGMVTVDEILKAVNIALGAASIDTCPAADGDDSGTVTVDEILTAVTHALNGCPA